MVERIINASGGVVAGIIILMILTNLISDPLRNRKTRLQDQLVSLGNTEFNSAGEAPACDEWQGMIEKGNNAWASLIPPPPPLPDPGPPPPVEPDLSELLKGVRISTWQIGSRIRIITVNDRAGSFHVVGDRINGCTITAFDRQKVTFSLDWNDAPGGPKTLSYSIPRERGI